MREIEFRGKREDTGEWAYGYLYCIPFGYENPRYGHNFICEFAPEKLLPGLDDFMLVRPGTVGQYTGLKDKNGVKIFEGDIVRYMENTYDDPDIYMGDVIFKDGCFMVNFPLSLECLEDYDFEVIGNIHDCPELLEAGK